MTVSREGVTVGATALLDWISQGEKGRKSPACRGPASMEMFGSTWSFVQMESRRGNRSDKRGGGWS